VDGGRKRDRAGFTPKRSAAELTISRRGSHSRTSMSREDQQVSLLMTDHAVPMPWVALLHYPRHRDG
jgi:hypothetical protein